MQRYRTFAPYLLPLVCVAALLSIAAQKKESGSDPYIPTKLEWLTAEMNARARQEFRNGFAVFFIELPPNTIEIHAAMAPDANRQSANGIVQEGREMVQFIAEARGWDDWLVIREQFKVYNEASRRFE